MIRKKLLRDKIPDLFKNTSNVVYRVAEEDEYQDLLKNKLVEEVNEFLEDNNSEELADILEVIHALCELLGITFEELEQIRLNKQQERGGFSKRIVGDIIR